MRALLLACLLSTAASAGILRDIQRQAEEPRPTATPAPASPTPQATPTPAGWDGEPSPTPGPGSLDTLVGTALLVLAAPFAGPVIAAGDHYTESRSYFPYARPPARVQVQLLAGAGWLNSVHDGDAELRLALGRVELELDWLRMQEAVAEGGRDQFNQYQALALWRFVSTAQWRGRVGFGAGLLSPLNGPGVRYGGLAFSYQLERQFGRWIPRLREDLSFPGPLLQSASRLTLGYQWGPLELYAGGAYRDDCGIGFGGLVSGALGTF